MAGTSDPANTQRSDHQEGTTVPVTLPAMAYAPGDRVERTIDYIPGPNEPRLSRRSPRIVQRGTVQTADPFDGSLTVAWDGDWGTFRTASLMLRHVDPADVAQEREAFGFAVGDRIETTDGVRGLAAAGVAMELFHTWFNGTPMVRICWQWHGDQTARHEVHPAARFASAETAALTHA
ncbi:MULTISPECIES: hypothetical protein [unclassified Streptomyces]|uniref:hypothetical protein n=1 Tax=unclassified Streptomyces TaxID=2593676 RepID=UPI0035DCBEC6